MRVLIIEDEDHVRRLMRLTLEATGYEVVDEATGEQGLERFGDGTGWDAVLLDQRLPGMDGLATLAELKHRQPDARVVMVTAFASIELAVDAMKLGATDFLRKPTTPESLRGAVAAAIGRAPAPRPRQAAVPPTPEIVHLTMNGFRIVRRDADAKGMTGAPNEHRFRVIRYPDPVEHDVTVIIDPDEIDRVSRLTRRALRANGGFWREQAERGLAEHLWSKGEVPAGGRLELAELPREAIDLAAGWPGD